MSGLPLTMRLTADEVSVTVLVDTFTSPADPQHGAGIDAAGGAYITTIAEPSPSLRHPGRVDQVMTGRTMFRWIPSIHIERM